MKLVIALDNLPSLVGRELAVSDWVEVTQEMIDRFADVVADHQWIHVDIDRATRENGGTIAHGFLLLSLLATLSDQKLEWRGFSRRMNYGFNRVRFTNVVRSGARVRLRDKLLSIENKATGWLVTRDCRLEIYGDTTPALVADWLTMGIP